MPDDHVNAPPENTLSAREPYVTQFDAEAGFWQYLNGLRPDGLVVELIQNELDAHATETRIRFEADRLVCQGNGERVDADGWKRLSYITGAGKEAPRKRNRIGVKNHGLKTCFKVGDEILIQSDQKRCKQTLYRDGPLAPPAPAAFKYPVPDESAPQDGCRIEVAYRTRPVLTGDGEPMELPVLTPSALEAIFLRACAEVPNWFLGVIRPGVRNSYRIHLDHHRLGSATFSFGCTAARPIRGGAVLTRSCDVVGDVAGSSGSLRESAFLFEIAVPTARLEIPEFYQSGPKIRCEIAWRLNRRGAPTPTAGLRRYPIAYTGQEATARTGLGLHYSAPFISDLERHGTSPADLNPQLIEACDAALVKLLRDHLVLRHGARAISLLLDPSGDQPDRVLQLTELLLSERAIPLAGVRGKPRFGPRRTAAGQVRPVVVPAFTWAPGQVAPDLSALCPRDLDQIHPDLPGAIIALLASTGERTPTGWTETRVTFDESDALNLLQPATKTAYFPWPSEAAWRRALGNPAFARRCLNVVVKALKGLATPAVQELRKEMYLPDSRRTARPLSEMFSGNRVPAELTVRRMPALLHSAVATHEIFRQRGWRPKPYTFEQFLDVTAFETEGGQFQQKFWAWLRKNFRSVPGASWPRLAAAAIWPGSNGEMHKLATLCQPDDARIAAVLAGVLHLPARELLTFQYLRRSKRRDLCLRRAVSEPELAAFCANRFRLWPPDRALTEAEETEFRRFENDLAILAGDKAIVPLLVRHAGLALAHDRVLRPLSQLHAPTPLIESCLLLPADLLKRTAPALDEVLPARQRPSSDAILRALELSSARTEALIARLSALRETLKDERRTDTPAAAIACIPLDGRLLPPSALAFRSNRGDYWGEWKIRLGGTGVSADVQEIYRFAGVTSGEPNPETSVAFFEWLNAEPSGRIAQHLEMVIRHLGHERSVRSWWEVRERLPCVPVEMGGDYRLVGLSDLRRQGGRVFLPDSEELVQCIRAARPNPRLMLAVISHQNVTKPVSELLRAAGARSLREAAASPVSVRGEGSTEAPSELTNAVAELRSRRMLNLAKRLAALDFPETYLREHWRNRLEQIQEIRLTQSVIAAFQLGGRLYIVSVRSGFDEQSGVLWLKRGESADLTDALYGGLVQRVFENAPKYAATVLEKAVHNEFRELFLFSPALPATDTDTEDSFAPTLAEESEPGEAFQTHHPTEQAPTRNVPRPGPIPKTAAEITPGTRALSSRSSVPPRRAPIPIELAQTADLKENQYAWHCQMCLTTKTPAELAPEGSYVELAENRQKLMEAHHLDHVGAGGARHAGNLVVLCYWHHHEFGNALSRGEITKALAAPQAPRTIMFPSREGGVAVDGYLVTVKLASTQKTATFFFTSAHREHWLAAAATNGGPAVATEFGGQAITRLQTQPSREKR